MSSSLFIDNKYTRWYFQIINARRGDRSLDCYTEKHHIIPRCMGGKDNNKNLVVLTAREHYICHLLLTKMVTGKNKSKMGYALLLFARGFDRWGKRKLRIPSRIYEYAKKVEPRTSDDFTPEWKAKISEAKRGRPSTIPKGQPRPERHRKAIRSGILKSRKENKNNPEYNIRQPCSTETATKISDALKGKRWANNPVTGERKYVSQTEFDELLLGEWLPGIGPRKKQ